MVKRRLLPVLSLLVVPLLPLYTEASLSVKLNLMNTIVNMENDNFSFSGLGTGSVTAQAEGNKNIKALITLDTLIADTVSFDVSKAYIKVRFPGFRITLGKTRLSWGEGFYFNAGDVIFESSSITPNLTADEFRLETDWLASFYIPLGAFSFVETVVRPPHVDLSNLGTTSFTFPNFIHTSAGMRIVGQVLGIKLEGGYLYNGFEDRHKPYISLHGALGIDWYVSASTQIPTHS
ncbi:MAG: hypothetical protein AB1798_13375, partial [Spirochaetota bacterium]